MKTKLSPLQRQIWEQKYRFKAQDGAPIDQTIEASWQRIARALAAAEREPEVWQPRFLSALQDFQFLPAGRIQAGAGTDRQVTLFNCFVMGTIPDDMGGIFQHLREAALTLQQGGGIGYDFSTLRPKGAPVKGVGADASGPLSFMDVWDAMCRTIMSAGSRRGAMMATLSCDHPDIEDFIDAKRQAGRLTNFNLSVLVSDAFMRAVEQDQPWPLQFGGKVYRTLPARALWDRLMRATYDSAEPGVIFIDRINRANNLHYCEKIAATNPCGEQPLPPYGACLLGSINLSQLVADPFTDKAHLDLERLEELTALAVRMLDNAIDVSRFPLPQQKAEAEAKRRIGLGITGLADVLIYCGLTYGSAEAIATTEDWMRHLRNAAYRASVDLAAEKGAFPLFDRDKYLAGESIKALPEELRKEIARYGIRNALVTSVAPTGTISLLAGNVSSGLEPVFAFSYRRHILLPDGTKETVEVGDPAWRLWQESHETEAPLPPSFVSAETLSPEAHLSMQAAVQKYIDSSVSKTINLPPTISFEDFSQVYRRAYELGCKGCTTYRPSAARGAVLETGAALANLPPAATGAAVVYMTKPLDRPVELPGRTYKLKWPESDHALYITLNDIEQPGTDGAPRRRPFEIFINSKNMEHYAWTVALTRMISAVFRRGGDVAFVVEELKAVFDPRGGAWLEGRYVPSLLAAIGSVIEQHMIEIGFLQKPQGIGIKAERAVVHLEGQVPRQCPKCGTAALIRQEGCDLCTACGHSNCQ